MNVRRYLEMGLTVVVFLLFLTGISMAKVTGVCSNCHTMHNSQDNSAVVSGGPYRALTKGDCIGCHSSSSASTFITNGIPIVYNTNAPTYGPDLDSSGNIINDTDNQHTLAGGNFYWVAQTGGDAKGHNVSEITGVSYDMAPPGFGGSSFTDQDGNDIAGGTWPANQQVTCAGLYGCHGTHTSSDTDDFTAIYGAHHADDSTIDGSTVGKSYRFLYGIVGKEDTDWEASVSSTDHNQYKGVDRNTDEITGVTKTTISYLCALCHGYFHSEAGGTEGIDPNDDMTHPWIRHPTDYDMGNTASGSEYRSYGGTSHTYDFIAPVASSDVSSVVSTVFSSTDDAIVMCLSCHRAHGSPYDDILRWNYSYMSAGSGYGDKGCFACHTTKDD